MAHHQLIDSLTAHISLYHSHTLSQTQHRSSNPRSSILKWFSSLTIHQRQAHLTVIDPCFVQIIIQMLCKLRAHGGHGSFIVLPDFQTRDLPTICFKKSRGLLSRVAQSNQAENIIFQSTRLFCSKEGEKVEDCSCSFKKLDALNVTEHFVEDVDRFVEAMDKLSNGEFLRGDESELSSDWVEFGWLKAKGYYSLEAFVANRLELGLRLAWLSCNSGKRRGVKLKDKLIEAGIAANVYWRKKGCVDWWRNLEDSTRKKVLTMIMGKAAKSLTHEIMREVNGASKDEIWLFSAGSQQLLRSDLIAQHKVQIYTDDIENGTIVRPTLVSQKPTILAHVFNCLFVLHDIIVMSPLCLSHKYDIGKLFFSTLSSVCTISDCVFRKLRGFLMVISLDYTKLELLEEPDEKFMPNKSKERLGSSGRKKKGRNRNNKRPNSDTQPSLESSSHKRSLKDLDPSKGKSDVEDFMTLLAPEDSNTCTETSSSKMEMAHMEGLDVGKVETMSRRSKKEKKKTKKSAIGTLAEHSQVSITCTLSTCTNVEDKLETSVRTSDNATNVPGKNSLVNAIYTSKPSNSSFLDTGNGICTQGKLENDLEALSGIESCYPAGGINSDCKLYPLNAAVGCDSGINDQTVKSSNYVGDRDIIKENSLCRIDNEGKSNYLEKLGGVKVKEHYLMYKDLKSDQIYDSNISRRCSLYELPGVPSVYMPSINSHLPPATDRLHLDVGHNWHNRFCHSFVPTVQQTSNSSVEGGCNQIFSRPLPMSLDWPPTVRSGVYPSVACSYDSGFISRRQSTFSKCLAAKSTQRNSKTPDDEGKCPGDAMDVVDLPNGLELGDECDSHWVSEEEFEVHAVSGVDYSQYFGGGIMYWNSSDYPMSGFSRPPSLSSDDSTWAWREADMNRAVDDMVAFPSSYSTTGLTSPTAASFCTPFEALGPGHQAVGYVMSGNDGKVLRSSSPVTDTAGEEDRSGSLVNGLSGEGEGKSGDSHPYPILRPIIIPNLSRERSRPDFKRSHDHKSPCLPPSRREQPRIKRPPSPVVLCVPRAPCPPPPSPVSDSRKQRGFPTVRSGSSSPRHWGMRGWYHDGSNSEEGYWRMDGAEIIWPSWRSKNLAANSMIQPLSAALLQDRLLAISQLGRDQDHPDVAIPLQPPELQNTPSESVSLMHNLLHEEIESFYKKVAAENMAKKPFINWAVKRVTRSLQVLWPRSRTNVFGSNATGLSLPSSDVDLVVCLPPVRNLEPIKEAGILEGRNGIKETCLQHAARYLANQDWVKNDSLKTVENTAWKFLVMPLPVLLLTYNHLKKKQTTQLVNIEMLCIRICYI